MKIDLNAIPVSPSHTPETQLAPSNACILMHTLVGNFAAA